MKKTILTMTLAMGIATSWAAKAWNMPITITQPDGTTITVFLHGDENFSWYTSLNGTILNRVGNTFTPITESADAFFAKASKIRKANAMKKEPVIGNPQALFPHTGSPKALVILAQYQDKSFSLKDPKKSFDQYLNKTEGAQENFGCYENRNYGSVRQYFNDMSSGQFTPQFDIVGPVTLPNDMTYYGGTNSSGNDERASELVSDACDLVKDSVDFSLYDNNNDGYVDLVYVIYAGYGQSMGAANNTIWPKATYMNSNKEYNGKKIYRVGVNNELLGNEQLFNGKPAITGIGLFIHEFSHCLGLPDFYASRLTTSTYDNQGMEDWSIMDNGSYKKNGWVPTAYTAWEREAMGWSTIETLTEPQQLSMQDIDSGGKAYRIRNSSYENTTNDTDEYFVIQNIKNIGWNEGLGGNNTLNGLMVYHVDYNPTDFAISHNNVNNVVGHPKMGMVPADGKLVSSYRKNLGEIENDEYNNQLLGDVYGDSTLSAKTTFEQTADIPNSQWWTEGNEVKLYNIHVADNGLLYVDFNKEFATDGINNICGKPVSSQTIYSINGINLGTDFDTLPRGIYIIGGKKVAK